ncbi:MULTISPECIES: hypothetical protein [unclassified Streptomyces]|uniref:hypothetical protein n=1 Tax=unclassified Streptomyces TaxID=2593676 RepID=UPI000DC5B294|nr:MULTISPECIES: hypothetical protein [unclassified Streptomyces]MYT68111.1 hypothetical protein [Streptomyces sp. SID8367]RAJ72676.1 hypothetical protein K377_07230 [Streptomyces sp. PsTaAH-137]
MSYSIFLLRFVDSEVVALDAERFRQVTEPYVVAGGPGEGFSQLRAEDGGEADLYHGSDDKGEMSGVTATHFARGAMLGVLARLARALGASIVPQDGAALIFHENDRPHLPAELQGSAVVIAPTENALQAAFDAR